MDERNAEGLSATQRVHGEETRRISPTSAAARRRRVRLHRFDEQGSKQLLLDAAVSTSGGSSRGPSKKRSRDQDPDQENEEDQQVWHTRRQERAAEVQLRAMSFAAREHCARYPHWQLLSWIEKLAYARNPLNVVPEAELLRRQDERLVMGLMDSVDKLTVMTDHVVTW